jgi:hypothetical protein
MLMRFTFHLPFNNEADLFLAKCLLAKVGLQGVTISGGL